MKKFMLMVFTLTCFALPVLAEDEVLKDALVSDEAAGDAEALFAELKAIAEPLSEGDQKHFYTLYQTQTMIGAVKTVRDDVGKAVKACGEENPDLAEKMSGRFAAWTEAVDPVVAEADGQVRNMMIAQDYVEQAKLTAFFDKVDQVRAKTAGSLNKVPVTSAEACEDLHDKMDDTQADIVSMIEELLVQIPRSLGRKPEAQSDAAAEASKSE